MTAENIKSHVTNEIMYGEPCTFLKTSGKRKKIIVSVFIIVIRQQ